MAQEQVGLQIPPPTDDKEQPRQQQPSQGFKTQKLASVFFLTTYILFQLVASCLFILT